MNQLLFYLLQVIAASGLLYGYYHVALRNKKFHRYNRFYLLAAVVISITIPFLNIPVYFSNEEATSSAVIQTLQVISSPVIDEPVANTAIPEVSSRTWFTTENLIYLFYIIILSFFFLRVLVSLVKIRTLIITNTAEKIDNIEFINTNEPGTPFSFFRWLFWNKKIELNSEKGEQIFRHELFHIQERHSWDIIFMELVSTIFWLNPFFHLMKKELKAIHEFLADEFAITENRSWQYAELLLMQVLNTNNHLVNPFFHNQIKRRIAMITSSSKPSYRYLRKLMVLPVTAIIIFLFAFSYKNKNGSDSIEFEKAINPITVVVDAGHGGSDPGAKTRDKKYTEAKLTLEIAKKIRSLAHEYNINVFLTRDDENFSGGATNKADALRKTIELINNVKPDAFVAIHMNTTSVVEQNSRSGIDGYVSSKRDSKSDVEFASAILNELKEVYTISTEIRKRHEQGIFVLDKSGYPSILLECGYINNPKDLSFIIDKTNQEKIARAILKGMVAFANKSQGKHEEHGNSNYIYDAQGNQVATEYVYDAMGNLVVDTIPKVDTIYWVKDMAPPAKKSPTQEELNKWTDAKMYGVWLDGKRINNNDLAKYKPSDFSLYWPSKLAKNALNYGKHYYQIDLYTHEYYEKAYLSSKRQPVLVREITRSDTLKPPPPLMVINGDQMPGLTLKDLERLIPGDSIVSMTVLNEEGATKKYGAKGKNGAIEVKTKSWGPVRTIKVINDSTEISKRAQVDNKVFVKVEIEPGFPGGESAWKEFLRANLNSTIPVDKGAKPGTYTVIVQFVVDKDGNISDLKALTNHGFGMEQECIRVMRLSPKWVPAKQNGHIVKAYKKQPMTFVLVTDAKSEPVSSNSFDPSSINFNDPEFKRKWREMILEIKAIAWKQGKAAYVYKGRTYVFGRIVNPDSTVASFTEQNGTNHVFLLNGELINSVDELNQLIKRSDVKKFGFISREEALKRFNRNDAIAFIETDPDAITRN